MGKHFLRRATLKILLLPRAACSYYIYFIYNRFETLKKVLHELPQNEGNNSHFRLSKNAVSNETCGKKLDNSDLIDKMPLRRFQICTIYVRVTTLRAAQNALAGRVRLAGRSLPTSGLSRSTWNRFIEAIRKPRKFRAIYYNFCYYFWSTLLLNRNKHSWQWFFFIFHKFPLRSTLLFPILPYSVSGFFGFIHVFILYLNTGLVMWRKNTNPTSPDYKWKVWHCLKKVDADRTPHFHRRQRHPPTLNDPPKNSVVQLNRLRTGVGRFHSCLYKWGMASPAACECGSEEQTVDHVVLQWPIHRPLHGLHGLTVLDDETIEWLLNACPEI